MFSRRHTKAKMLPPHLMSVFFQIQLRPRIAHMHAMQKLPYNPEDGDYFEAAWLLLANIHLGAGKLALAQEFCDSALAHNASSDRALTLKGACAEVSGDFQVLLRNYRCTLCGFLINFTLSDL